MLNRLSLVVRLVACLVFVLVAGLPERAHAGLNISGAIVDMEVEPGETYRHVLQVGLGEDDSAADIRVEVGGLGQQLDGVTRALPPDLDTSPYTARSFITLDKNSFRLEPGTSKEVTAFINVPGNVGAGGRYAVIRIYTVPSGGGQLMVSHGIAVPVKLTVKDSSLIRAGEITGLSTGGITPGKPLEVSAVFKNTGNYHYKIKGEVTVYNALHEKQAFAAIPLSAANVIPTMSRQLSASLTFTGGLSPGVYTVQCKVIAEDGTVLAEAAKSFNVYPRVSFADIKEHWARDDIEIMAGLGIVKGMDSSHVDPDGPVTRAQFTAFLNRSLGIEETTSAREHFVDVPAGRWYHSAVETAYANDLAFGYPDNRFRPNDYITREELAAMIVRGFGKGGKQVVVANPDGLLAQFKDQAKIGAWARWEAAAAVQEGIIKGRDGGRFAPRENATRAEAICMLKRMLVSLGRLNA
ncbi:MAG: S-layer homology domain-containing protein [Bacillota bacterium]